jgi:hypothetical protein
MKIEAGKYYRRLDGQVTGPIEKSLDNSIFMHYNEDGTFRNGSTRFDLISEVYVSDTPPAVQKTEDKWRARLLAAGPGPFIEVQETKTLRDEFVMRLMDRDMFAVGFKDEAEQLYRVADAMMEARKK